MATVTYTGDNLDDVAALGVHIQHHATQDAVIVFAEEGDLNPVGILQPGQAITVDDVTVSIGQPPVSEPDDATEPPTALYNPADHTIDEVNAHMLEVDDPGELERIIAAEQAGKKRAGLLKPAVVDDPQTSQTADPAAQQ